MIHKLKSIIYRRYDISFSKSGDDIQLYKLINNHKPGVYIDIGCFHPIKASNTYHFYLRNWKGICIDPNPRFKKEYIHYRPKDRFINKGIANQNKDHLKYYLLNEPHSSMSTFDRSFISNHNLDKEINQILSVPVTSLK